MEAEPVAMMGVEDNGAEGGFDIEVRLQLNSL